MAAGGCSPPAGAARLRHPACSRNCCTRDAAIRSCSLPAKGVATRGWRCKHAARLQQGLRHRVGGASTGRQPAGQWRRRQGGGSNDARGSPGLLQRAALLINIANVGDSGPYSTAPVKSRPHRFTERNARSCQLLFSRCSCHSISAPSPSSAALTGGFGERPALVMAFLACRAAQIVPGQCATLCSQCRSCVQSSSSVMHAAAATSSRAALPQPRPHHGRCFTLGDSTSMPLFVNRSTSPGLLTS